jgi:hypothetical protein
MSELAMKAAEMADPCWICGSPADSSEHKAKKSDLKGEFGTVTQVRPLFLNDANNKNRVVGSLKSDRLKWPRSMCTHCNGTRTQPYDTAWEHLSQALRDRRPGLKPGDVVRANSIFRYDTARSMQRVHLYFVKALGCVVKAAANLASVNIDLAGFANAILARRSHPDVYIRFGAIASPGGLDVVSASDLSITSDASTGTCELATWFYNVNGICALVAYVPDNDLFVRKEHLWHPRQGTSRLVFGDFS